MTSLSEDYAYFIDKYGSPDHAEPAPADLVSAMDAHLPQDYLDFLGQVGLGMWLDGYFQFCDPRRFAPIVDSVFRGDPTFDPRATHVLGFSAFGTALLWNEMERAMELDFLNGVVSASEHFTPSPVSENVSLGIAVTLIDGENYDAFDRFGKPMFRPCLKRYGQLSLGQVYAPALHPALGGDLLFETFRPASALEAMALMIEAVGQFRLVDSRSFPPKVVRPIGRP